MRGLKPRNLAGKEEPLINVDVNLGHEKVQIQLYEDSNTDQIAKKFAKQHKLE
jgi:hypothetical protein